MSVIEQIPDTLTIPKNWFHFLSKRQLIDLGDTPSYYPGTYILSHLIKCTPLTQLNLIFLRLHWCPLKNQRLRESGWWVICIADFNWWKVRISCNKIYFRLPLHRPNTKHIINTISGSELAINLWKECITNPQKFDRNSLQPPPATTVVAVTNLKPSISNGPISIHNIIHTLFTAVMYSPQTFVTRKLFIYRGSASRFITCYPCLCQPGHTRNNIAYKPVRHPYKHYTSCPVN